MEIELQIEQVGLMGQGVARDAQGNLYFVPGAIPGDHVKARYEGEKRYRDAELIEVLAPSQERVSAECPVFDSCGGCDWQNWKYSAQLQAKEKTLSHVLTRSEWLPEKFLPTLGSEALFGYRNRIQLHAKGKRLGFYRKGSHEIIDIDHCAVTRPELNEALRALRAEGTVYAEKTKIELALQPDGSVHRLENQPHAAAGFAQVHDAQNAKLRSAVTELICRSGAKSVLELFSGNGNFTLGYADHVREVFAVDSSSVALEQGRALFGERQTPTVAWVESRVDSKLVRRLPRDFRDRYDTLLLDPPRAGAEGCIAPLVHAGLKSVIYVSCSPVAFTKDVQCLRDSFRFEQLQIIDMFPHTRHIEFVAYFSRLPV